MCGRFALGMPKKTVEEALGLELPEYRPRFNVAPGAAVLAVGQAGAMYPVWGFRPSWSGDQRRAGMINARSETVFEKPMFRDAARERRCLVPAQAFYEWKKAGGRKLPHAFTLRSGELMALAGIWEQRQGEATCAILTTRANELMAPVHHRMPVIIAPEDRLAWLGPGADEDALSRMLAPYSGGDMAAHRVSAEVNSPANDSPDLLSPVRKPEGKGERPSLLDLL